MTRDGWLVSNGTVLASGCLLAESHADRGKGLLGRTGVEGAIVLERTRWVHTIGMRFAIDVAYLDADGIVMQIVRMPPPSHRRVRCAKPHVWSRPSRRLRAVGSARGRSGGVARVTGRLVLVSTPIGNLGDLPPRAVESLRGRAR